MNFNPLKDFLDYYLPMLGIPGSDTVIYKNHKEIFRHQSGIDSRRLLTPMRDDAIYNLYSASGVFTCIAAMQLVERGELLVTDPLYAYIPEFRDVKVGVKDELGNTVGAVDPSKPITLKHLFTMTSGIGECASSAAVRAAIERTLGQVNTVEVVKSFASVPLEADPGDKYIGGLSLDVLGAVVEIVSGVRLSDFMENNVFGPLGMKNTSFRIETSDYSRLSSIYELDAVSRDAVEIPAYKCDRRLGSQYDSGGFGIASTVEDFSLFADALALGGVSKNGERIISEYALDVMTKNVLTPSQLAAFSSGANAGYGFGYGFSVNIAPESVGNLAPHGEFFCDGGKNVFMSCDREYGISVIHAQNLCDFNRIAIPRIRNLVYSCMGEKG